MRGELVKDKLLQSLEVAVAAENATIKLPNLLHAIAEFYAFKRFQSCSNSSVQLPPIQRDCAARIDAHRAAAASKRERLPYPARSQGEANLHMVLHRATEILKSEIGDIVTDFASSILRPGPIAASLFFPNNVLGEDRQYFKEALERPPSARRAHNHRGFLRAINGDVDDRDEVARRGLAYCFDRSDKHGVKRHKELSRNFCRDHRAGRRSIHGYKDWIDILSRHERHSTTGRVAASDNLKLERAFESQGAWSKAQKSSMQHRRKICAHLLNLILRELSSETERESVIVNKLPHDEKQERAELATLEKARCEAADRIMRIISEYGAVTAAEDAEYLRYTIEVSQRSCVSRKANIPGVSHRGREVPRQLP